MPRVSASTFVILTAKLTGQAQNIQNMVLEQNLRISHLLDGDMWSHDKECAKGCGLQNDARYGCQYLCSMAQIPEVRDEILKDGGTYCARWV